jgi:hypothetical protein
VTVLELVRSSLRLIGRLGPGRGAGPSELTDALLVLNSMLDAWNTDRLSIYSIERDTYTLVPGQQAYTIGPGGQFAAPRPAKIENASILVLDNPSAPVERGLRLLDAEQWAQIPVKSIASTIPTDLYNDRAAPVATLSLFPIPSTANQLILSVYRALSAVLLTDTVTFPPGYADAVRYGLACRLAPEWNLLIRPDVAAYAVEARAAIQLVNAPSPRMISDGGLGGTQHRRSSSFDGRVNGYLR